MKVLGLTEGLAVGGDVVGDAVIGFAVVGDDVVGNADGLALGVDDDGIKIKEGNCR